MIGFKDITGIILAGGKSSRMGTDKGLLELNGKLFIEHIIEALKPLVNEIIIVSDATEYDNFGLKRIEDNIKNAGPIAGLYSGLKNSKTDCNLVLSCDIPLIKTEMLRYIINETDSNSEIVQIESKGKSMPLIALYNKSCSNTCKKLLNEGERRLRVLAKYHVTKTIKIDSNYEMNAININTKEQFRAIKHDVKY